MKKLLALAIGIIMTNCLASNELLNLAKPFLPNNPIILEAGVYNAAETLEMSTLWPSGFIFGFEPVPYLFQQCSAKTASRPNIKLFQLALSDKTGTATFNLSTPPWNASGSLLNPKEHLLIHPQVHFTSKITVNTITLDEWATQHNVTHVDFIWFDLQGSEFDVLRAGQKMLKNVNVIVAEVNYREVYEKNGLFADLLKFLEEQGFVLLKNIPVVDKYWGDAVFVKANLLQKQ